MAIILPLIVTCKYDKEQNSETTCLGFVLFCFVLFFCLFFVCLFFVFVFCFFVFFLLFLLLLFLRFGMIGTKN